MNKNQHLLDVSHLNQIYNAGKESEVRAIDDVSFYIKEGETFGLVGESGSGKTTTGRAIMKLFEPTSGQIHFNGLEVTADMQEQEELDYRKEVQMIFQDPYASLNPRMKILDIIAEGLDVHHLVQSENERKDRVYDLLDRVGLNKSHASRYPHEFSGGQRQRIGIARALAVEPKMIIADEPISALDVSIQAQIVTLLQKLQEEENLTYLFIAHDLSMVKYISDRIGVMYKGKLLEIASADELFNHPLHPYTKSLISAIPQPDPLSEKERQRVKYQGIETTGQEIMHEVTPGHYIYCRPEELARYQKDLAAYTI